GTPALAVADPAGNRIDLFTGTTDGESVSSAIDTGPGSAPSAVATAQLDADGYADLLVGTPAPAVGDDGSRCDVAGCVVILRGSATGVHTGPGSGSHVVPLGACAPADIAVGDA